MIISNIHPNLIDLIDESYLNSDRRLKEVNPNDNNFGLHMVNAFDVSDDKISNRKVCIVDSGYDKGNKNLPDNSTKLDGWSPWGDAVHWNKDDYGHGSHVAGIIVVTPLEGWFVLVTRRILRQF